MSFLFLLHVCQKLITLPSDNSDDPMAFSSHHGLSASLKHFPSGYEDAFATTDMVSRFEQVPPEQPPPPDSSIDHNNKLLSFSHPVFNFTLLDYSLRRTSISMSAQLHGMFFLAESPWTTSPADNAPPQQGAELTCYRRNLFQITGSITLPRSMRYIMTDQGDRIPILAQELTVSATESVEGNPVKIISVPWKTPAANSNNGSSNPPPPAPVVDENPPPKVEKEPPPIPLDIMAGQDLDTDYATFPIAWKRLQFRVATANNGRRKELQQHFVVRLKVVATLSTGAKIPISEIHSAPVIVRGRSPRNFQSRKDLPLSGSAAASRKHAHASSTSAVNRTPTSESAPRASLTPARTTNNKSTVQSNSPDTSAPAASAGVVPPQQQASPPDWTQVPQTAGSVGSSASLPSHMPTLYQSHSSPEFSQGAQAQQQQRAHSIAAPIDLSILEDEDSHPLDPNDPPTTVSSYSSNDLSHKDLAWDSSVPPTKMRKLSHDVSRTESQNAASSIPLLDTANLQQPFTSSLPFPNDSADLLYEYFPLGLDDWQTPVDAVYRPHVAHHTTMPETKFVTARGRSKRYFAEDVY